MSQYYDRLSKNFEKAKLERNLAYTELANARQIYDPQNIDSLCFLSGDNFGSVNIALSNYREAEIQYNLAKARLENMHVGQKQSRRE